MILTKLSFSSPAHARWEIHRVEGREALSSLFEYTMTIRAYPGEPVIDALGTLVSCRIASAGIDRFIHGYVSSVNQCEEHRWQLSVVPQLAVTRQRRNLRVFQNINVVDLVVSILAEYGLSAQTTHLIGEYPEQPFWLQYQETDFDFISRLLERAGIHYFFRHAPDAHHLVLIDLTGGCERAKGPTLIWQETWRDLELNSLRGVVASQWAPAPPEAVEPVHGWIDSAALPVLDPNGEQWTRRADSEAKVRNEEAASRGILHADAMAFWMSVGERVSLARNPAHDGEYCVVSMEMFIDNWSANIKAEPARLGLQAKSLKLRPHWKTPVPVIPGVMMATVVGPASEAVNVDEHGRIKVRFHWDEAQRQSDSASCWIRVAQGWAGPGFGAFCLPRVGTEVLVSFIQGNPNSPVVTGSLYNERDSWPVPLPAQKLSSGITTRSEPGGDTRHGHRLVFDDRKDAELIQLHSEKDLSLKTRHDLLAEFGNAAHITVGTGRSTQIKEGDDLLDLGQGSYRLTAKGDCTQEFDGQHRIKSRTAGSTISTAKACLIESNEKVVIKVGSSEISISPAGISLKAPQITLKGDALTVIDGGLIKIG